MGNAPTCRQLALEAGPKRVYAATSAQSRRQPSQARLAAQRALRRVPTCAIEPTDVPADRILPGVTMPSCCRILDTPM